jgi:hypothetical protein
MCTCCSCIRRAHELRPAAARVRQLGQLQKQERLRSLPSRAARRRAAVAPTFMAVSLDSPARLRPSVDPGLPERALDCRTFAPEWSGGGGGGAGAGLVRDQSVAFRFGVQNRNMIRDAAAAKVCMGTDKPFTRSNPRWAPPA